MIQHHTAWHQCPYCNELHDGATEISTTGELPDDGSFSVCLGCSKVAIFDASVPSRVRLPTDAEAAEIAVDTNIRRAILLTQLARGER